MSPSPSSLSAIFGFSSPYTSNGSNLLDTVTHAALGISYLQQTESDFTKKLKKLDGGKQLNPENPEDCMELAGIAEMSGNLSPNICFYLRAWAADKLHQQNMDEEGYDSEVQEIKDQMRDLRKREDLRRSEYSEISPISKDYLYLQNQYINRQEEMFEELLLQLGLPEMFDLYKNNKEEYRHRYEDGERQIWESVDDSAKLASIQDNFEKESEACANAGAYHAATIMIGSAIESALLLLCIKCPEKIKTIRPKLSDNIQGKNPKDWTLGQLISVTTESKWLTEQVFERVGVKLNLKEIARSVSDMRNMVHPGAQLRSKHTRNTELSYLYAREVYTVIKWSLHGQDAHENVVDNNQLAKTPYHSIKEDSYHTCTNCREGKNIEKKYLRYGRGGRIKECWLCELYRLKGVCSPY